MTYQRTYLESPISSVCGLLVGQSFDDRYFVQGTGTLIAPHICITARHVIEDFWRHFMDRDIQKNNQEGEFYLRFYHFIDKENIKTDFWDVRKIWECTWTDIALLYLKPRTEGIFRNTIYKWNCTTVLPYKGQRLTGFGHAHPKVTLNKKAVQVEPDSRTSVGIIQEIFNTGRDSVIMPYPSIQLDARFEGSMSGGPIVTDDGKVIGIITTSIDAPDDHGNYTSYAAQLWPLLGLNLDDPFANGRKKITVKELAQKKVLYIEGIDQIILHCDRNGNVVSVEHI